MSGADNLRVFSCIPKVTAVAPAREAGGKERRKGAFSKTLKVERKLYNNCRKYTKLTCHH